MFQPDLLKDRVVLVTGGGTGIGKAIAMGMGALGARVVIASRSLEHLEEGRAEIAAVAPECVALPVDVRDPERVQALMAEIERRMGGLDVLVNNAAGNFLCPAAQLSPNGWRSVVGIVLDGTFFCCRYAHELLVKRPGSSIVNIVATYAWTGNALTAPSAAAKAGVLALTQSLAVEWAPAGIRVNAIAPGIVPTKGAAGQLWADPAVERALADAVPMGRFADPAEIAAGVIFLASPLASYVTGECLVADGGLWLGKGLVDIVSRAQGART